MHEIAFDLLILLTGVWLVAVTLRPLGLPTVMGELIVGVLVGPAVFGFIEPDEAIQLLAEIGIFFLMFHAGIETQPLQFFDALKRSLGVAIVGAIVPFSVSFGLAMAFGVPPIGATFIGLTMTATAVVITLKCLKDLGLSNTRVARVIVASCVIDDLLTLVVFSIVIGVLTGGAFEPMIVVITLGKVVGFFTVSLLIGRFVYPRLSLPFRSEGGKGFTFVLLTAIAAGLFAEAIGLHMILGAYLAGLFFEEEVAHPNLVRIVLDRTYGIAYSFLGPIFFMSLGFSITFDITGEQIGFLLLLTGAVIVGQILSAGGMALRMGMPLREALTVGVGMCGRAEMAFILASLALAQGAIDASIFSVLIFTSFLLNLFTPLALKGCSVLLQGKAARREGATRGVLQIEKFSPQFDGGPLSRVLPALEDAVVIYGYGPEVDTFLAELDSRSISVVVLEEDESVARSLQRRARNVVWLAPPYDSLDLAPLARARALVANGPDDRNALIALRAREEGLRGPIVAMIHNPLRRRSALLSGVTMAFTPSHVLAAVLAARASHEIRPRVTGAAPLGPEFEVAEIRIHEDSPLAGKSLAEIRIRSITGAHIVGRWVDDRVHSPPGPEESLEPGMLLMAAGTPESIRKLSELTQPILQQGRIVVLGGGDVGRNLTEILREVGEEVLLVDPREGPGVDIVGDVIDPLVLERAEIENSRVVILALEKDGETLLATAMLRDLAPTVPLLASVARLENVERIQEAGADFALSVGQVAGQILAQQVLGEIVAFQPRIKLVKVTAGPLAGKNPMAQRIRERTGCTIVAVERGDQLIFEFPPSFTFEKEDALYLCGTTNAIHRYEDHYSVEGL